MRLIDLAQPVTDGCPHCPVHPPVRSRIIADHPADGWRMEHLDLAIHTGSHVDAPLHKIAGGKAIDDFPLERFVGPAVIADCRDATPGQPLGPAFLAPRLPESLSGRFVLLATGWGDRRASNDLWHHQSPYLAPSGAEWLVENGVPLVGIDHYSIGGSGEDNTACHEILLGHEVLVVEELHFPAEVFTLPQPVTFWAVPVYFPGHSGAFCRPLLQLP
jgi:kynurenine formamidase